MNSSDKLVKLSLALAILQTACCETPLNAQSGDYHPGDPIHLGSVHKSFQDEASPVNTVPQPSPVDSSAQTTISQPARLLQGGADAHFLQGGVQHSEQLAPVQSGLQVGTTFDATKLEKLAPVKNWFRVPPWLAGSWKYDDYNQVGYQNYKTGTTDGKSYHYLAQGSDTFGSQRDRMNGIWDYFDLPFVNDVTTDKVIDKDLHTNDSVVFDSGAKIIVRIVYTRTVVDKITNIISSVNQMECFTTLTPAGPDMVRSESSIKKFDDRGNPIDLSKTWRIGHKNLPFKQYNFDRSKQDVRPSFAQYLKGEGLENLVPLQNLVP